MEEVRRDASPTTDRKRLALQSVKQEGTGRKADRAPTAYVANATRRFHQSFYGREVNCVCNLQRVGIDRDAVLDPATRPEHRDRLGSIDCQCHQMLPPNDCRSIRLCQSLRPDRTTARARL